MEAHREISDNLLREMKDLRQRSEAMEKRLRELEIDNAVGVPLPAFVSVFASTDCLSTVHRLFEAIT